MMQGASRSNSSNVVAPVLPYLQAPETDHKISRRGAWALGEEVGRMQPT
jgi:hypothetical protein